QGLAQFAETYERGAGRMMADKLGLAALDREGDQSLLIDLFALLQQVETDMTLFFRLLATVPVEEQGRETGDLGPHKALVGPIRRAFYAEDTAHPDHIAALASWLRRLGERVRQDGLPPAERLRRMNRVNPKYVLRNYLAQLAIDALEGGD